MSTTEMRNEQAAAIPSVATLTELLREAEQHHGKYEATAPKHHWSGWYAAYIVARERGRTPEQAVEDAGRHMAALRSST